jgi:quercetin dioxygenase-like cupin family protein
MPFIQLKELPVKELLPGFEGRMIHTGNITVAYFNIKAGSVLPEHSHPHEQVTHILEGQLEMNIEGDTEIIEAGKVAVIPSNKKHSGRAITDCVALDVFQPVREDYKKMMEGG